MKKKINIAAILKNCPKGMELNCVLFNKVVKLEEVQDKSYEYPIIVKIEDKMVWFDKYGRLENKPYSKCVLFPKGKSTWIGFKKPFTNGDIVAIKDESKSVVFMYKNRIDSDFIFANFALYDNKDFYFDLEIEIKENKIRVATQEEKLRLLTAIKADLKTPPLPF